MKSLVLLRAATNGHHMKAKISAAEQMKVHTMFVIGNRDTEANAVSVRVHGKGNSARSRAAKRSQGS